jgi:hypothetical protein
MIVIFKPNMFINNGLMMIPNIDKLQQLDNNTDLVECTSRLMLVSDRSV